MFFNRIDIIIANRCSFPCISIKKLWSFAFNFQLERTTKELQSHGLFNTHSIRIKCYKRKSHLKVYSLRNSSQVIDHVLYLSYKTFKQQKNRRGA